MSSLFFWIIVLSILIPFLMRWHRRSTQGRNQRYFGGPGVPGEFGGPMNGQGPPRDSQQRRDGYTQQDYFSGPFRQLQQPRQEDSPPIIPLQQDTPPAGPMPPQHAAPHAHEPQPPVAPVTPPVPSAPQGYRARKLAELDAKFSAGELAMEDYMTQRDDIMRG